MHLEAEEAFGDGVHGAMAAYVKAPARCLHHIPASLAFEKAALTEPCCVAYNAVCMNGRIQVGDTVLVLLSVLALFGSLMVSYVKARAEGLGFSPGNGMAAVGLAPREIRLVIVTVGLFTSFVVYFFRYPERTTPAVANAIVSPAELSIFSILRQRARHVFPV